MQNDEASSTSGVPNPLDFNTSSTFTLHEELPSRGYCRLFKAQRYGKWYVLKGLRAERVADPVYIAMIEKEFASAVTLDHPNIVHTYSLENDEVAGRCFVMEYIEGRTLAQFLDEKPSATKRRKVALQLLDAMQYYHARQIVHRDLKPSNIMVTENGDNVKVIDFGLADADDYAVLKEPAYTKGYAAPEQMTPGAHIDCRADIYAFGVILRQLFAQRYAYVSRRCMNRNPERRYDSATAVRRALLRHETVSRWGLVVVALLALAVLATILVPKPQESAPSEPIPDTSVSLLNPNEDATIPAVSTETVQPTPDLQPANNLTAFKEAKAIFKAFGDSLYGVWMKNATDGTFDTYAKANVGKLYLEKLIMERKEHLLMNIPTQSEAEWEGYWQSLDEVRKDFNSRIDSYMESHPLPKPDGQYDDREYKRLSDSLTSASNRCIKAMAESRQRRMGNR